MLEGANEDEEGDDEDGENIYRDSQTKKTCS